MTNQEFIDDLLSMRRMTLLEELDKIGETLRPFKRIAEEIDDIYEKDPDIKEILSSGLNNSWNLAALETKSLHDAINSYESIRDKAESFMKIKKELEKIDFQKLPVKYLKNEGDCEWPHFKENPEWKTVSFDKVVANNDLSEQGFVLGVEDGQELQRRHGIAISFDTKDPKIVSTLNQAGFFSFEQAKKIFELSRFISSKHQNDNANTLFMDLAFRPDPTRLVEQEFEVYRDKECIASEKLQSFYKKYNDMLPIPIDKETFDRLSKNHFMEPVNIYRDNIPDYVTLRAEIGDAIIDFVQAYSNNDELTVNVFIPESSLNIKDSEAISKNPYYFPDNVAVYNPKTGKEDWISGYSCNISNELLKQKDLGLNDTMIRLPENESVVRQFLDHPNIRNNHLYVIPLHSLLKESYQPSLQKNKEIQR